MFGPPSFDTTYPYPIEGAVSQIAIDDLGRVYAYKGSVVMMNNGIKWSDTTYFPTSMGFLSAMAVDPDRNVYLGTEGSDLTNSVYKIDAKTKVINVLCSKMPTFPVFPSCSIASIAAVSSSEVYVAGNNLIDTFPQLQIAKWSKVTNEWTKVGSDSGMISGLINTLIIDTQGKSGTILASGYLYNNTLSTMEVKQFVGEYAQQCNAFFTLLPSGVLHTYTLINYAFGAGKLTYKWNWGDGSPLDTGAVPSHTYKSAGNYQICVEIKDSVGCSSSFCTPANSYLAKTAGDMVYVNVVKSSSISLKPISIKDDEMRIFPNPAQNTIIVEGNSGEEDFDIFITDLSFKTIIKEKISTTNGSFRYALHLNNLSSGLYFLLQKTQSGTKTYKIVKE